MMNNEYETDRGEPEVTPENWLTDADQSLSNDTTPYTEWALWKKGFDSGWTRGRAAGYKAGYADGYERGYENGQKQQKTHVGPSSIGNFSVAPVGFTEDDVRRLYEQTTRGKMK